MFRLRIGPISRCPVEVTPIVVGWKGSMTKMGESEEKDDRLRI